MFLINKSALETVTNLYDGSIFEELITRLRNDTESSEEHIMTSIRQKIIQSMNEPNPDMKDLAKTAWYINMFDQQSAKLNQLVLRCMADTNMKVKKIGYSACLDILSPGDEFSLMATSLIRRDLESSNMFVISFALQAASSMMSLNMSHELFKVIETHLTSSRPYIRKKAIFTLFRIFTINDDCAEQALKGILSMLRDPDYGVLAAVLCVLAHAAKCDTYIDSIMAEAPRLLHILKNTNNNWVRIRILKLLTLLYEHNNKLDMAIESFVQDKVNYPAYSVRYECLYSAVQTLNTKSLVYADVKKQLFIVFDESDSNLRLIGLKLLEIAARRDRETGTVDPIPEEYFEKMINLSDVDDRTTNYYALRAIATYATGDQASSICDKLLDVGVKRNMPYLVLRVIEILERENLLGKSTSLFLLGDMWRNSALLSSSKDVISKMDELAIKISQYHRIVLIVLPTLDKENTPRENVDPQLYATLLNLLEKNIEEVKKVLKQETIAGYTRESFLKILKEFHVSFKDDSLLYMTSASILSKLDSESTGIRPDLECIYQYIKYHKEADEFIKDIDFEEIKRDVRKKAALKTAIFDRDELCIDHGIDIKMETSQYSQAPWPNMVENLPHAKKENVSLNSYELSRRTKDILMGDKK